MIKSLLFIVLTFVVFASAQAQLRINSPYSRFGLGDLYKNESGISRSMGGISFGIQSPEFINSKNPASYSRVDSSTFLIDVGYSGYFNEISSSTAKTSSNYFNLDYLKAAFPILPWWRTSLSLTPYSQVGYSSTSTYEVDSVGKVNSTYLGDGGLNKFTLGNGFKIGRNFSIGVNTSFLFGNINYSKITEVPDNINVYNYRITNSMNVKSFLFDFGAQYNFVFGAQKDNILTLGAVFGHDQNLSATSMTFAETYISSSTGYEYIKDTIVNSQNGDGTINIPIFYGGGFNYQKSDKWSVGFDYTMQNWSAFSSFAANDTLKNAMAINFGGSYRIGKVVLRAGARYNDTYLMLKGNSITELGMTFGTSVPLFIDQSTKTFPVLDIGAEVGTRGTHSDGLIQQKYVRFFLGLSIRSNWFKRPKYY